MPPSRVASVAAPCGVVSLIAAIAMVFLSTSFFIQAEHNAAYALALLARLGKDAMSGVAAAEAATFADQAVTALREAIRNGWAQCDLLKGPDFEVLRDSADFQKLAAELEKKSE